MDNHPDQRELELAHNLELVRLGRRNASSNIMNLQDLLTTVDDMYPGIEKWLDSKVLPGLRDESRCAYMIYYKNRPVASAIAKRGADAKICNLRVSDDYRDRGLGGLLFCLMALSIGDQAQSMYFTIPESTWGETDRFFTEYGFTKLGLADKQYRLWNNELVCKAPADKVMRVVSQELPLLLANFTVNGSSNRHSLVITVRPEYAEAIMTGRKTIEVRKRFSQDWIGAKAVIYASSPLCQFVGEVDIEDVTVDSPSRIWLQYGDALACDSKAFQEYCDSRERVYAIKLKAPHSYRTAVGRSRVESILGMTLHTPQSHARISPGSEWGNAASLSRLLQTWPVARK
jgi:predicted transcriptional regulator/ribosomal protein S18 acetylase RimI-like enzyme